jgi:hypothetical protein
MKPKVSDVKFRTIDDERGNLLRVANNGKRIVVSLKLASEERYRKLGFINLKQKVMNITRNSKIHLMRAIGGYGFNYRLLDEAKKFENIRLKDENSEWLIPRGYVLEKGSFLHFLAQGFEKQIFISLTDIEQFKRPSKI